jgi:hypothetical protein
MRRAAVATLALVGFASGPALAQDAGARFPGGTVVVLVPVQAALPASGGAWPGNAATAEEAVRAMDAELEFALAERRGAADWAVPSSIRRRVSRNPVVDVDPDRLAYQGLIEAPDSREQIYEPLHGQLRTLAALFGTRYVILPVQLRVEPLSAEEAVGLASCGEEDAWQRAVLIVALIDIRRSAVMWHGDVAGPGACSGSGSSLAGLADVVARELAAS